MGVDRQDGLRVVAETAGDRVQRLRCDRRLRAQALSDGRAYAELIDEVVSRRRRLRPGSPARRELGYLLADLEHIRDEERG